MEESMITIGFSLLLELRSFLHRMLMILHQWLRGAVPRLDHQLRLLKLRGFLYLIQRTATLQGLLEAVQLLVLPSLPHTTHTLLTEPQSSTLAQPLSHLHDPQLPLPGRP